MSKFSDSGSESSYESDAESDVGHSSNMMSIFANYYGIEASTPEAAVENSLSIDSPSFNAAKYAEDILMIEPVEELLHKDAQMIQEIRTLDSDMQMLVYENYNKFISATETIKTMKMNVEVMYKDTKQFGEKMQDMGHIAEEIDQRLKPSLTQVSKLVRVRRLLSRLEFLCELPKRLQDMIERELYGQAVSLYKRSIGTLKKHEHVLSFKNIQERTEAMMNDLRGKVVTFLDDQSLEASKLTQYVSILRLMNASKKVVSDRFLHTLQGKLRGHFLQFQSSNKCSIFSSSEVSTTDLKEGLNQLRTFHQLFVVDAIEMCKGISDLFCSPIDEKQSSTDINQTPSIDSSETHQNELDSSIEELQSHEGCYQNLEKTLVSLMEEYNRLILPCIKIFFDRICELSKEEVEQRLLSRGVKSSNEPRSHHHTHHRRHSKQTAHHVERINDTDSSDQQKLPVMSQNSKKIDKSLRDLDNETDSESDNESDSDNASRSDLDNELQEAGEISEEKDINDWITNKSANYVDEDSATASRPPTLDEIKTSMLVLVRQMILDVHYIGSSEKDCELDKNPFYFASYSSNSTSSETTVVDSKDGSPRKKRGKKHEKCGQQWVGAFLEAMLSALQSSYVNPFCQLSLNSCVDLMSQEVGKLSLASPSSNGRWDLSSSWLELKNRSSVCHEYLSLALQESMQVIKSMIEFYSSTFTIAENIGYSPSVSLPSSTGSFKRKSISNGSFSSYLNSVSLVLSEESSECHPFPSASTILLNFRSLSEVFQSYFVHWCDQFCHIIEKNTCTKLPYSQYSSCAPQNCSSSSPTNTASMNTTSTSENIRNHAVLLSGEGYYVSDAEIYRNCNHVVPSSSSATWKFHESSCYDSKKMVSMIHNNLMLKICQQFYVSSCWMEMENLDLREHVHFPYPDDIQRRCESRMARSLFEIMKNYSLMMSFYGCSLMKKSMHESTKKARLQSSSSDEIFLSPSMIKLIQYVDEQAAWLFFVLKENPPSTKGNETSRGGANHFRRTSVLRPNPSSMSSSTAYTANNAALQFDIDRLFSQQVFIFDYTETTFNHSSVDCLINTSLKALIKCFFELSRTCVLTSPLYHQYSSFVLLLSSMSSQLLHDASNLEGLCEQVNNLLCSRYLEANKDMLSNTNTIVSEYFREGCQSCFLLHGL